MEVLVPEGVRPGQVFEVQLRAGAGLGIAGIAEGLEAAEEEEAESELEEAELVRGGRLTAAPSVAEALLHTVRSESAELRAASPDKAERMAVQREPPQFVADLTANRIFQRQQRQHAPAELGAGGGEAAGGGELVCRGAWARVTMGRL